MRSALKILRKKKFIFWKRIFSGVFFAVLFFLSAGAASAQLTKTDVFVCKPSGTIPVDADPCPNAEASLVRTYSCAFGTANPYCPAVNFTYCDDRKLVASCSGAIASGEYVCKSGYTLVGGVCLEDCPLPWGGTIPSGQKITAYQFDSVPCPQICESEDRVCDDGFLNGSYTNPSCEIEEDCSCAAGECIGFNCSDECGNPCFGAITPTPGTCGLASRLYSAYENDWVTGEDFCVPGSPNPEDPVFPLPRSSTSWTCSGICGGDSAVCRAIREAQSFWREVAP